MIAHLDLDAFFAAVEQLDRPELRGKPVVVGGDPRSRGVVSTASYEARTFGIRSAMSAAEAYRRCPKAIFVKPDMARYRERSQTVWAVVGSLVERYEQVGIDEGYLDLTGLVREPSDARALLGALQAAVRDATGLSCSLGCGSGKTVAKIASDHRKPGGVFVVAPGREAAFLAPLPLRALPGIGPRGEQRLLAAGLATIGDLAAPGRRGAGGARHGQGRPRAARARARHRSAARGRRGVRSRDDRRGDDVRPRPARPARDGRRARADRRERVRAHRAQRLRRAHRHDEAALRRLRDRHALAHAGRARGERGGARSLAIELLEKALADRRAPVRLLGVYTGKLAREAQLELPLE